MRSNSRKAPDAAITKGILLSLYEPDIVARQPSISTVAMIVEAGIPCRSGSRNGDSEAAADCRYPLNSLHISRSQPALHRGFCSHPRLLLMDFPAGQDIRK